MVKHPGCVNRIRCQNFGEKVLAANWSERAEVHIWDLEEQLKATHDRQSMNNFIQNKQKNIKPVFSFSGYRNEGYALDWSPVNKGEYLESFEKISLYRFFRLYGQNLTCLKLQFGFWNFLYKDKISKK
jgi:hypothetical protein